MKIICLGSVALVILVFVFAILVSIANPLKGEGATPTPSEKPSPPAEESAPPEDKADNEVAVSVLVGEEILEMPLSEYLVRVVAAEMPATFEMEALKAQTVAARTYTMYKKFIARSERHPSADVCSDHTCCKAYKDEETQKAEWGSAYEMFSGKIKEAVDATDGMCLTYENEPILAVFHSSSYGFTEDSGEVWQRDLPYLQGVESPETENNVPKFVTTVTVSHEDFKRSVTERHADAAFGDDIYAWIGNTVYSESGRVKNIDIGGVTLTGVEVRDIFDLRSSALSIEISEESVTFTVKGYGHGVGMSQYGANALALEGSGFEEILEWYYVGAGIENMSAFLGKYQE
jgi:stage II sporulation protein D